MEACPAIAAPAPREPHVLLFPYPSHGHLNPLLDLDKRLSGSGILCTLALTPFYHAAHSTSTPHLKLLLFAALPLPADIHDNFLSSTQSPDSFEIVATRFVDPLRALILSYARHDIYASSDEHHDTLRLPPISCLISDSFMPWTVDLAAELGIPRVEMWTASVNCYAFGFYLPQLVSKGLIPFKEGHLSLSLSLLLSISSFLYRSFLNRYRGHFARLLARPIVVEIGQCTCRHRNDKSFQPNLRTSDSNVRTRPRFHPRPRQLFL